MTDPLVLKDIRDHLIAIILAGKDPIAIISSWTLYELAQRPDVVQKLRAEIEFTCVILTPLRTPIYRFLNFRTG
jgi:cytochrome P450